MQSLLSGRKPRQLWEIWKGTTESTSSRLIHTSRLIFRYGLIRGLEIHRENKYSFYSSDVNIKAFDDKQWNMHENIGAAVLAQTRLSDTCFAPKMMSVPQSLMPHICHWSKQRVIFMFFMRLNLGAWNGSDSKAQLRHFVSPKLTNVKY